MTEEKNCEYNVKLFKQTFEEAERTGFFNGLPRPCRSMNNLVGMITGAVNLELDEYAIEVVNKKLIEKATEMGADYVFGIKYIFQNPKGVFAYGDAYKIKETE